MVRGMRLAAAWLLALAASWAAAAHDDTITRGVGGDCVVEPADLDWISLSPSSSSSASSSSLPDTIIDFVADTGDGFKSTFAVARALANAVQVTNIDNSSSSVTTLRRGDVLIVGGDIAYPESTIDLLMEKFVFPFRLAFDWNNGSSSSSTVPVLLDATTIVGMVDWIDPTRISTLLLHMVQTVIGNHPGSDFRRFSMKKTKAMTALRARSCSRHSSVPAGNSSSVLPSLPTILAVLGNHDAIDGGEGFQRLFLENAAIGGWAVRQNRSYWGAKPEEDYPWAIIGVHDQQAAGANPDIDPEQWFYLSQQLACAAASGQRLNIVLVLHAPFWLTARRLGLRLAELFRDIRAYNHTLRLILSGDQHVYAHYSAANEECPELVISGGGGAFTHSTMHLPPALSHSDLPGCDYKLKQAYPSRLDSVVLHFDAMFFVLQRRVVLACGMLFAVLIEYHWRQTLLESKDRAWWLMQVWLSRRSINRQGQIQIIVPPRYNLWMCLASLVVLGPAVAGAVLNTKPLVLAMSTRVDCLRGMMMMMRGGGGGGITMDNVLRCMVVNGGDGGNSSASLDQLAQRLLAWLSPQQVLLAACLLMVYFGPPKRSARKWEGAIDLYLLSNRALLPPPHALVFHAPTSVSSTGSTPSSPRATASAVSSPFPRSVPTSLAHTLPGQELLDLIQHDYSHWERFRVIRDKESKLVYDWLVKIAIATGAVVYLTYFILGNAGVVVLVALFGAFLACLHAILHPLPSIAVMALLTSFWGLCRGLLLLRGGEEEVTLLWLCGLVFASSFGVCAVHWARAVLDFVDIFDWANWQAVRWWRSYDVKRGGVGGGGGKRRLLQRRPSFMHQYQVNVRLWFGWRRLAALLSGSSQRRHWAGSGVNMLSSVLALLHKGLTLSFVFVLITAAASAWFGPEVFADDVLFSAARNEHYKHFLRLQLTPHELVVYPIMVNTSSLQMTTSGGEHQRIVIPRRVDGPFVVAATTSTTVGDDQLDPIRIPVVV